MAAERTAGRVVLEAVAEARRIRGSVVVEPADDARRWGAFVAAVDGSLELRVGLPRRRFWQGGTAGGGWLGAHGFELGYDTWTLTLPATTSDEAAAERLSEALIGGHGVDPDAVVVGFVSSGQLESDMPPVSAPHEEQIAAALRTCVSGRMRGAIIGGGQPETRWASVFAVDGTFRIEREVRSRPPPGETDDWDTPLTPNGCDDAAREVMRRTVTEWPDAAHAPLFLQLLALDSG